VDGEERFHAQLPHDGRKQQRFDLRSDLRRTLLTPLYGDYYWMQLYASASRLNMPVTVVTGRAHVMSRLDRARRSAGHTPHRIV